VGTQKNNNSLSVLILLLLGLLLCAASLGLYLWSWGPAGRAWLLMPFMTVAVVLALVGRYRWMYWLSSSSSVIGLLAVFMATQSNPSLTALSFLYLFVRV
jgi:hypothetical protein